MPLAQEKANSIAQNERLFHFVFSATNISNFGLTADRTVSKGTGRQWGLPFFLVTAIPTFLQFAPGWRLRVTFGADRTEQSEVDGPSALRERLAEIVTEAANPCSF